MVAPPGRGCRRAPPGWLARRLLTAAALGVAVAAEDSSPSCAAWAAQGECGRNAAYMLSVCAASCASRTGAPAEAPAEAPADAPQAGSTPADSPPGATETAPDSTPRASAGLEELEELGADEALLVASQCCQSASAARDLCESNRKRLESDRRRDQEDCHKTVQSHWEKAEATQKRAHKCQADLGALMRKKEEDDDVEVLRARMEQEVEQERQNCLREVEKQEKKAFQWREQARAAGSRAEEAERRSKEIKRVNSEGEQDQVKRSETMTVVVAAAEQQRLQLEDFHRQSVEAAAARERQLWEDAEAAEARAEAAEARLEAGRLQLEEALAREGQLARALAGLRQRVAAGEAGPLLLTEVAESEGNATAELAEAWGLAAELGALEAHASAGERLVGSSVVHSVAGAAQGSCAAVPPTEAAAPDLGPVCLLHANLLYQVYTSLSEPLQALRDMLTPPDTSKPVERLREISAE